MANTNILIRGTRPDDSQNENNVTLKEWAKIVNVKDSYAYEQSRHDRIPGMFRVGKFVRVNLPAFYKAKGLES